MDHQREKWITLGRRVHLRHISWVQLGLSYLAIIVITISFSWYCFQRWFVPSALGGDFGLVQQGKIEALSAQLAFVQQGLMFDKKTLDIVNQENLALRAKIAGLEDDIAHYQSVLKLTKDTKDLALSKFEIKQSADGTFRYFLTFIQLLGTDAVSGELAMTLLGEDEKGIREYLLSELDASRDPQATLLKFSDYQVIQGMFRLPPTFSPHSVRVRAVFSRGKKVEIEKTFLWSELIPPVSPVSG